MELFAFWFICAVVTGIVASSRGRSGFGWFLLGCLISLFALILVALLPSKKAPPQTATETHVGGEVATPETHVRCPECKGLVHKEARKCMHCGAALVPTAPAPSDGPRDGLAKLFPTADSRPGSDFGAFDSELDADVLARRMSQPRDRH